MPLSRRSRALRSVILGAALVAALPAAAPRAQVSMVGKTSVARPDPTQDGDWTGTWYYASRMRRMALWMRMENGTPRLLVEIHGKAHGGEDFTSGWDGRAAYEVGGIPGKFELTLERADADRIEGRWFWEWGTPLEGRRETADFTIYRAGDGRQLVWTLANFRQAFWGGTQQEIDMGDVVWTFRKASRRQALWAELPF